MNDIPPPTLARRSRARRAAGLPMVYACGGCSGTGQMMNHVAVQLAQRGLARMGCIAAIGAGEPPAVTAARTASQVIALDGCALACTAKCLGRHDVTAHQHYVIKPRGIADQSFEPADAERLIARVLADLLGPVQAQS